MALINCPECGIQVSDKAEKCPKCAFPFKSENKKVTVVESKEGCFLQTLNTGCMVIAIIVGLIILGIIFS